MFGTRAAHLEGYKCVWLSAAKDAVAAAGRTMFAVESNHVSLLYYLMYAAAAGGLEPLISARKGVGAQEFRIKVIVL